MAPWMILRLIAIAMTLLMGFAAVLVVLFVISRATVWQRARRMGVAIVPIGVRLISLTGLVSPRLESLSAELTAAGFREVGRYATDRAPRATVIAFVHPERGVYGGATDHPTMGTYLEVTRTDGEDVVTATTAQLPARARTRPGTKVLSRPRASVAELLAIVEREGGALSPHPHTAEAFVRDWEGAYRRGMTWAYSDGPLRHTDPELQARLTGLPADEETAYFLKVRREAPRAG